jgi:hypothetical protein
MVYGLVELSLTCHVHIVNLKQEDEQSISLLSQSPLLEVVLYQATFNDDDNDSGECMCNYCSTIGNTSTGAISPTATIC